MTVSEVRWIEFPYCDTSGCGHLGCRLPLMAPRSQATRAPRRSRRPLWPVVRTPLPGAPPSGPLTSTTSTLRADQQPRQNGLTDWGYLPDQWRLANVAYPLFLRQPRVNDGGGRMESQKGCLAESFRPPLRPPTQQQARGASQKHRLTCAIWLAGQVSNLQPPDPKSGVLPVELPATGAHRDAVSTAQSVVAGRIPAN